MTCAYYALYIGRKVAANVTSVHAVEVDEDGNPAWFTSSGLVMVRCVSSCGAATEITQEVLKSSGKRITETEARKLRPRFVEAFLRLALGEEQSK